MNNKLLKMILNFIILIMILELCCCSSRKVLRTKKDLSSFNLNIEFCKAYIKQKDKSTRYSDIYTDSIMVYGKNLNTGKIDSIPLSAVDSIIYKNTLKGIARGLPVGAALYIGTMLLFVEGHSIEMLPLALLGIGMTITIPWYFVIKGVDDTYIIST